LPRYPHCEGLVRTLLGRVPAAALDEYDLLTSVFRVMFFDRVAAFTNLRMVRVSACPVLCG